MGVGGMAFGAFSTPNASKALRTWVCVHACVWVCVRVCVRVTCRVRCFVFCFFGLSVTVDVAECSVKWTHVM